MVFLILLFGLAITLNLISEQKTEKESQQMIEDCYSAGGTPVYDLCASEIKIIKLPGYDYAPEVSDYPSNNRP